MNLPKKPGWLNPGTIESMTGYTSITTFCMDFNIADAFGADAVQDTFNRAFREWKDRYEYLTELVLVLNWKSWAHFEQGSKTLAALYDKLWRRADEYAFDNLKGEELEYFIRTLD